MPTAMVCGAAGGIGRALVQALHDEGWRVAALCREPERIGDLPVTAFEADFADDFAVRQAILAAAQEFEQIDLWIYAAGDIAAAPVRDMSPAAWQRLITANLTGAFIATHHSLPLLKDDATLVYIGAVSERLQLPCLTAYAAAKYALEAFTTALSKEERTRKILLVRPTAVDTPLWSKVSMRLPKNALTPEQCAQQILAAASEGKTGQVDL